MAYSFSPLPPFMPAGGTVQRDTWADHGEWNDEQILFPGTEGDYSGESLVTQTGGYLITGDGLEIIIQ